MINSYFSSIIVWYNSQRGSKLSIITTAMKKILIVEDESLVSAHLKIVLTEAGYKVCGIADTVADAMQLVKEQQPDLVLIDILLKGGSNGIELAKQLTQLGVSFVYLSANFEGGLLEQAKQTLPFGFIVKPFREFDLLTTLDVAFFRHQHLIESRYKQEQELGAKLKQIPGNWSLDRRQLMKVASTLQQYVPFDYLNVIMRDVAAADGHAAGFLRIGFDEYQYIGAEGFRNITGVDLKELDDLVDNHYPKPALFTGADFEDLLEQHGQGKLLANIYNLAGALFFPLQDAHSPLLRLEFYSRKNNTYLPHHITLLGRVQTVLGNVAGGQVTEGVFTPEAPAEQPPHTGVPPAPASFEGIVGRSPMMLSVIDQVNIVGPLDTSVLILGESGTGKERVARSIHAISDRKQKPLVVVNCASLPASLVESELFGYEKGAFTGAAERRIGKFEMANGGTLFLDEIGELSLDMQVKLLRVLQEQEIERIGGRQPVKIDVRVIAATNRNLEKEMEEGRFRLDLYYRLFVFPIIIPPLRDRTDDILPLTELFVQRFARKYKKAVIGVATPALEKMLAYHWPGNVRELEHFIERSVLLAKGPLISDAELAGLSVKGEPVQVPAPEKIKTIDENERDHIVAVLQKCNGRIRGANGAAAILGLPPTTLHSKMKRLGIRYHQQD